MSVNAELRQTGKVSSLKTGKVSSGCPADKDKSQSVLPGGHGQVPVLPGGHGQVPVLPRGHGQVPVLPGGHGQVPVLPGGHGQVSPSVDTDKSQSRKSLAAAWSVDTDKSESFTVDTDK